MSKGKIEAYITNRLKELDKQKDMQDVIWKAKFSFGMDEPTYGHLPAWNELIKQKKKLVRLFWTVSFLLPVILLFYTDNSIAERFSGNWLKAVLLALLSIGFVMLFYVVPLVFGLFFQFRKTEREVRKLIYQDILCQIEKDVDDTVSVRKECV